MANLERPAAALAGALLVVLAGYALRRPWGVVVAFVPSFATSRTALIGPLDPQFFFALVTLAILSIHLFVSGARLRYQTAPLVIGGLFVAATVATTLGGNEKVQPAFAACVYAVAGLTIGQLMREQPRARAAFAAIGVPIAALAIVETVLGRHLWPRVLNGHALPDIDGWRAMATLGHPLIAGAVLAVLAVLVATNARQSYRWPIAGLLAIGALTTVSRSALLALAVGAGAAIVVETRGRLRAMAVAAASVAGMVALVWVTPGLQSSFDQRIANGRSEQQVVRAAAASTALDALQNKTLSVALGGGTGASVSMLVATGGVNGYTVFDNQYATSLFELGWVVLGLIVALGSAFIVRNGVTAMRSGVPALGAVCVVAGFTDSLTWGSLALLSWTVVGFALATERPDRRHSRRSERAGRGGRPA